MINHEDAVALRAVEWNESFPANDWRYHVGPQFREQWSRMRDGQRLTLAQDAFLKLPYQSGVK